MATAASAAPTAGHLGRRRNSSESVAREANFDKSYGIELCRDATMPAKRPRAVAKALRHSYEAALRGDLEPMRQLCWPDCVIHVPGQTPISGDVKGWDESVKWAARFHEHGGRTFREDVVDVVADENWAFMLTTYHAERSGRRLEDRSVNICRMRQGRVAEVWTLVGDTNVFNEIFA